MLFRVDTTAAVPVYAQLVEQVKHAIASGTLQAGEALPSRRELAMQLEINPLTVLKAYKELEADGMIEIRQGLGCFVTAAPQTATEDYRRASLLAAIDQAITRAREFGVDDRELVDLLRNRLNGRHPAPATKEKDDD